MNPAKRTPFATLLLIAANLTAAFLPYLEVDPAAFGFVPARPEILPALASLFLHENLWHVLGNMVFLAAAGPMAEEAAGSLKFFGVYMAAGLAGVAAHWAMNPSSELPLIGASGAVAGCVVLASVRLYRTRVPMAPGFSVPLLGVTGFWLLVQVLGGVVRTGSLGGGTSYWAHAGGALAGLLLALAYRTPREAERRFAHDVLDAMDGRSPAAALAAAERHLASHPRDAKAMLHRAEALARLGERDKAASAFLEAIENVPDNAQAHVVSRAAELGCLAGMPSLKKTHWAAKLRSADEAAAALLESVVHGPQDDGQRPDAMLALADLRRESDPQRAEALLDELIRAYPLHPAAEIAKSRGSRT